MKITVSRSPSGIVLLQRADTPARTFTVGQRPQEMELLAYLGIARFERGELILEDGEFDL